MGSVLALSIHADYRCAHSGACCTAGWAIPVEPDKQAALRARVLVPGPDGACRFFDRATRLCAVHRDHGERTKPDSCRHFPRVALIDDRGTHVTLSHFCPTAAGLLFADRPLVIIESAAAFPYSDRYEGLDARREWPPLVHRNLLFDDEAYDAWESRVVEVFATATSTSDALSRIAAVAEQLRGWTPGHGAMAAMVHRLAESVSSDPGSLHRYDTIRTSARRIVLDAIPRALQHMVAQRTASPRHSVPSTRHPTLDTQHAAPERVMCRYLAAKAFASWTAYQGNDVRTLVGELVLADALVRDLASDTSLFEAIREADRLLIHLADHPTLVQSVAALHHTGC